MQEKTIVFGKGYLGTRIADELGCQSVGRETDPLDSFKLKSFLDRENPDILINAIGKTGGNGAIGIDWCETHKQETLKSNVDAAIALARECEARKSYFVHLGSGCIYQGGYSIGGFKETDEPNFYEPQFYAKTKIIAENTLRQLPGLILRIRMPIDDRSHPRNLIDKLAGYSRVIQQPNSMTTIPHAIKVIRSLIERKAQGIYNLVNPGLISAEDIMSMYEEIVEPNHKFGIMSLDELNKKTIGKRSNCYLNTDKLKSEGLELPEIHQAVRECLEKYKLNLGNRT